MNGQTRVLVTGGAGFIGSHVADVLVDEGYQVAVLDNLSSGTSANVHPKAGLYHADITDPEAVERVFQQVRPQLVSHHAAQISVSESARDPVFDARTNVIGSLIVLEACRKHGVEHFTFASTGGALYGNPLSIPAGEDTPVLPLSPYGAAKASVETYLRMYRTTWGLRSVALRYANVYGPRQSPHGEAGVIAIFAGRMLAGESPVIFGSGEQERDFVYVGDIASANLAAMETRLEGSFNVGTGRGASVNEVASALAAACGFTGRPTHAPERPGEVQRITLDAQLLSHTVGWKPQIGLEQGLASVVEHLRNARAS